MQYEIDELGLLWGSLCERTTKREYVCRSRIVRNLSRCQRWGQERYKYGRAAQTPRKAPKHLIHTYNSNNTPYHQDSENITLLPHCLCLGRDEAPEANARRGTDLSLAPSKALAVAVPDFHLGALAK